MIKDGWYLLVCGFVVGVGLVIWWLVFVIEKLIVVFYVVGYCDWMLLECFDMRKLLNEFNVE